MKKAFRALVALVITMGISTALFSQTPESKCEYIRIRIEGVSDTSAYLANYYGNKLYYADTAKVDSEGWMQFDGIPYNQQGKYAVVAPGQPYFDIIVGNENIELTTDTINLVGNIKVIESRNNQLFYDYVRFINERRSERSPFDAVVADSLASEEEVDKAREALLELNDKVQDYQKSLIAKNPDLLFGKYVNMMMDVVIPDSLPAGEEFRTERYNWYKAHYWDNVDLTDNRMVRDQAFHNVLERYVTKTIPQIPDSVITEAKRLIDRVEGQPDLFKYIVHNITYTSETSKLMCMDKAFVWMIDNYYARGKCDWMEPEKLQKILDTANDKRFTLCDEVFPDIRLKDMEGQWKGVLDIDSKYTVVVVWESSCGHCKKELPILADFYAKWKDKGVEVYAIGNDYELDPWLKFINEKELPDWINVSDDPAIGNENPDAVREALQCCTNIQSLNFRRTLDISSTPKVWLLDENKVIRAKQLGADQLEGVIQALEGIDPEESDSTGEEPEKEAAPNTDKKGEPKRDKAKDKQG